ncbi:MAG TPA: hypothetical protein VMT95_15310 [Candidatus Binatia bacterium]|nr:hypothetical protein [Candidatus Binatia bacterium]
MASQLIVGIFPSTDAAALEKALSGAPGLDRDRLRVFMADSGAAPQEASLAYTLVKPDPEEELSPELTHGTGLLTDFGGTDVPGVTDSREQSLTDFGDEQEFPNYLGFLAIPDDEVDNFNEAIAEGRSVVAYSVESEAEAADVRRALRAVGLRNVEIFRDTSKRP